MTKENGNKIFSTEGIAILVVAVICLLIVIAMYFYVDKRIEPNKVDYEALYEQTQIPSFNIEKYKINQEN